MGKKKSPLGKDGEDSRESKLAEMIEAVRQREREERVQALAEGRRQRSAKFKTPKDYDRKDKTWKNQPD